MLFLRYRVFVGCVSRARIVRILRGRRTSDARVGALRAIFAEPSASAAPADLTTVGDRRSGGYAAP
jgi:hypothetical protein